MEQSSKRRLSWNRRHFFLPGTALAREAAQEAVRRNDRQGVSAGLFGGAGGGVIVARPQVVVRDQRLVAGQFSRRGLVAFAAMAPAFGAMLLRPEDAYAASYTYYALKTTGYSSGSTCRTWTVPAGKNVVGAQTFAAGAGGGTGSGGKGGGGGAFSYKAVAITSGTVVSYYAGIGSSRSRTHKQDSQEGRTLIQPAHWGG